MQHEALSNVCAINHVLKTFRTILNQLEQNKFKIKCAIIPINVVGSTLVCPSHSDTDSELEKTRIPRDLVRYIKAMYVLVINKQIQVIKSVYENSRAKFYLVCRSDR